MPDIRPAFRGRVLTDLLSRTLIAVLIVLFIYGGFAYWVSKRTFDEEMGARLLAIANLSAGQLRAEWLPYLKPQGELAQAFRENLEEQRLKSGAENLLILDSGGRILAEARNRYESGRPYWPADIDPAPLTRARRGEPAASILLTFRDGGIYKVGYAPIRDRKGRTVGILAVEASARFVSGLRQFAKVLFFFGMVCLALAGGFVLVFGRRFVRPIKEMADAAQKVSMGDFSARVNVSASNELGALTHAFNEMASRLESHNEYILESMSNGLLVIDLKNNVTSFNRTAGRILGLDPEQVVGRHFEDAFGKHPEFLQAVWPSLTQGKKMTDTEVRLGGENPKILDFRSTPLLGEDERILGTEIILTDETQVKRLESEVKVSEKMATIGQLAASIAHEIRNPLGAMKGFTELLARKLESKRGEVPAGSREIVADIAKEIEILNRIVTNFLVFAKPAALELLDADLSESVRDIRPLILKEARPRKVKVRFARSGSLPVRLDPDPFRRAVLNVVLNAVQLSPAGGTVEIEVRRRTDSELRRLWSQEIQVGIPATTPEQGWACVDVRDEGPGIDPAHWGRLFTPFFTTKAEGFGLGLSITRKILESHGGGIGAVTRPEGGALFVLFLPVSTSLED